MNTATAPTYRRNITKSKAGHYRLTLIDKATGMKVTSEYGWCHAETARLQDEARLAAHLTETLAKRAAMIAASAAA